MLSTLVVFVYVAAFTVPVLCCRPKEYETRDGQCCPMCHEGTVVRRDCTPDSGTRCGTCEYGTFMKHPNGLTKCFSCTSCSKALGLFVLHECKATSDTVCGVLPGYFCKGLADDSGCSSAEKHNPCAPGHRIKEPGTNRTDTVCELCQPGYFSLDGVDCTAWTICSESEIKLREGNTTSNVVCGSASRTHYALIPAFVLLTLAGLVIRGRPTLKTPVEPVQAAVISSHDVDD